MCPHCLQTWEWTKQEGLYRRRVRKYFGKRDIYTTTTKARAAESEALAAEGYSPEAIRMLQGPEPTVPPTPAGPEYRRVDPAKSPPRYRVMAKDDIFRCPMACLQCVLKDLPCSLAWVGGDRVARCSRCVRNQCDFCIQQAPSVERVVRWNLPPRLTWARTVEASPVRMDSVVPVRLPGRPESVVLFVRGERGIAPDELRALALELAGGDTRRFAGVLAEPLHGHELRGLALPSFQDLEWGGTARRDWRDYFAERRTRREMRLERTPDPDDEGQTEDSDTPLGAEPEEESDEEAGEEEAEEEEAEEEEAVGDLCADGTGHDDGDDDGDDARDDARDASGLDELDEACRLRAEAEEDPSLPMSDGSEVSEGDEAQTQGRVAGS